MSEKIGVVDVGGGYRGVYACGVLDWCIDRSVRFDVGVGVSAGSANIASYSAGQKGRNRRFYTIYGLRSEYAGMRNFLFKRNYIDLDYIYSVITNSGGEDPLDFGAMMANPIKYALVATVAATGQAKYFFKEDMSQDSYGAIKASCAIPFICQPYVINGVEYFDGALSDTIPVDKAFELGADRVVLLLTKPEEDITPSGWDKFISFMIRKKYPRCAQRMLEWAERYSNGIERAKKLEAEGKLLIVAPKSTFGVSTVCRDVKAMTEFYEEGYSDGEKIGKFLNIPQ